MILLISNSISLYSGFFKYNINVLCLCCVRIHYIDIRKRVSVSDLGTQQSRKSSYNPWADRRSSTMDDAFTDQLLFDIAFGQYGAWCVRA